LAPYTAGTIVDNVHSVLKRCDLCVADISAQFSKDLDGEDEATSPNPSVMHEVGLCHGMSIPVFYIGKSDTHKKLPANLQGALVSEYSAQDLKSRSSTSFSSNLADTIVFYIQQSGAPLPPGEFHVDGYRLRRRVELPYMIENAKYRIYILTTNLKYIHDKLKDSIRFAIKRNLVKNRAVDDGKELDNQSFKVDILTMDPESIVANARAKQLNVDVRKYRDELRLSLDAMRESFKSYADNVEIATYVSLPTVIMFVIDDTVVWSVPFPSQQSRMVPHFVISHDAVSTKDFISYFFSVKSQAGFQTLL
jgi:hypothetical protein